MNKKILTYEYVNELFTYSNGELFWKVRPREHFSCDQAWKMWNKRYVGIKAGGPSVQKREIRHVVNIDDIKYYRSIVVWCLCKREWPLFIVDHENRNPLDDRIENLRKATNKQQNANRKKSARNQSGFKGVLKRKSENSKWRYSVCFDGKKEFVGGFNTAEEAHAAYMRRMIEVHGEFACGG